jgi:hypothetical protein
LSLITPLKLDLLKRANKNCGSLQILFPPLVNKFCLLGFLR